MKFNINDTVKVRLTDKGRDELRAQHEDLQLFVTSIRPYEAPKEDDQGYSTWKFWTLLQMFGDVMCGGDEYFEPEIILVDIPILEQQERVIEQVKCPFPCGWKELLRVAMNDGAFLSQELIEGGEVRDSHRVAALSNTHRLVRVITAILDASEAVGHQERACQKCGGTGMADSGGTQPWGEQILVECDCQFELQEQGDGWIEWRGGNCPVPVNSRVDIKFRDGDIGLAQSANWDWSHRGYRSDIIAYRIIPENSDEN